MIIDNCDPIAWMKTATDEIAILREALERIAKLRETGVVVEDGRKAEAYLSDAEAIARDALRQADGGKEAT